MNIWLGGPARTMLENQVLRGNRWFGGADHNIRFAAANRRA